MNPSGFNDLKALIVDDFDNFRASVLRMLQEFGFAQVDAAVNGPDALRRCKATSYDLILCDYNLGFGKTGQQVLEEVRQAQLLKASSLYVMISAESSKQIVMAAYDYEPDAYLTKPITAKTLQQRLERLIAQRRQMALIYQALDDGDMPKAIHACRLYLSVNPRYTSHGQKLLGRLLLEHGDFSEAEAVYRKALDVRELDWAQVGMALAKQGQSDWVAAEQWAEQALKTSPLCMRAYDLQIELQGARADSVAQQKILEQAVELSPLSIRRQQQLGVVALENGELAVAMNALRRAVKLGEHSCYDHPDSHLNFIRAVAGVVGNGEEAGASCLRDAAKTLHDFESRFGSGSDQKLQLASVRAVFKAAAGDAGEARKQLDKAQQLARDNAIDVPLKTGLDWLDSYSLLNDFETQQKLLDELIATADKDQAALEQLDRVLPLPVSEKNRQWLAATNRQGIACYDREAYLDAIEFFSQAARKFPLHIGVQLNLLQAYLAVLKDKPTPEYLEKSEAVNARLLRTVAPDSEPYERYRQLQLTLQDILQTHQGSRLS